MAPALVDRFNHPIWKIFGGMVVGYVVILVIFTILLFLLPTLLYSF